MLYRLDVQPAALGYVPVQTAYAIDRSAWWPLVDRERWDHRVVMHLLERLESALFGAQPDDTEEADRDG